MAAPTAPLIAPQDDMRGWQFTVNLDSAHASQCSPEAPGRLVSAPLRKAAENEGLDSLMSPDHAANRGAQATPGCLGVENPVAGPLEPNDPDQHRSIRIRPGRVVFGGFPAHDRVLGVDPNSPGAMLGFQDQDNTPAPVIDASLLPAGSVAIAGSCPRSRSSPTPGGRGPNTTTGTTSR